MKILALDCSAGPASVAIIEEGKIIASSYANVKLTHSQTLLPMLDELRNMIELDMNTVDAIAIAAGPGSFTGLRIGAATAKGFIAGSPYRQMPSERSGFQPHAIILKQPFREMKDS